MATCKIRDVSELYALADKCARAEEGRRLPGENIGAEDLTVRILHRQGKTGGGTTGKGKAKRY